MSEERSYHGWRALLAEERLPACVLDLEAMEHNLALLLGALASPEITLRVASKSLRCSAALRHLLRKGAPRVQGLMSYSAAETAMLATQGFDDLLCAYPVAREVDALDFALLAERGVRAIAMVDSPEQVALIAEAGRARGVSVPVCLDVDVSLRLPGGLHLGVRRSPIRDVISARRVGNTVKAAEGATLVGVMAYEAQVAGMPDHVPGARLSDPVRRLIKTRSRSLAAGRRKAIVAALRGDGHDIQIVNGGGTGSVASTSGDGSVTEVTAGSGFYCPTLFDHYEGLPLRPALFFALPVVRRSDPDHLTCAGGGYVASGPPGADRMPQVHLPRGMSPLGLEGWGEVQTPFKLGPEAPALRLGDPVICRPAKAGELMERAVEVLVVRGEEIVERVPSYRGEGGAFL